jgi:hypothetical protein
MGLKPCSSCKGNPEQISSKAHWQSRSHAQILATAVDCCQMVPGPSSDAEQHLSPELQDVIRLQLSEREIKGIQKLDHCPSATQHGICDHAAMDQVRSPSRRLQADLPYRCPQRLLAEKKVTF